MTTRPPMSASRYSRVAIALHWVMALIIIGNLMGGFLHDLVPEAGGQRSLVMGMHKSFGLLMIGLAAVRLGWRLANPPPPLPGYFTLAERRLSKAAHIGFYAAMIALPLSGWVMVSRSAYPLSFFWLVDVPKPGVARPVADAAHGVHETLGWAMLALLALHLVAVAKHRWLDDDNLLARMGLGRGRG